jgi:NAD(P)-dependent dehydrogenase (short-subunit alcohol dehydrogenase family)
MTEPPAGDLFDLSGRTALVTGASRGLGRAIALAFAAAGANVVVTSRNLQACEAVAGEVRARGVDALAVAAHVGRWDQLPALVDAAYERFGSVEVLVNNAGSSPLYDSLADVSERLFDSTVGLNLKGPFRLGVLVGERMRAGRGGSIINISSLSAVRPEARALPYAAAKRALDVVTVGLAEEFAPTVRVNSIRPGSFATDVSTHWSDSERAGYAARAALGRVGEPGEIVGAALYLASDASSFTTGTVLSVDGGAR